MAHRNLEQRGLLLSTAVTIFMSILGVTFGTFIQSEAIFLDGFFNVVSFLMSIATLWVIRLQEKPQSKWFQFGHLSFIPLVNLSKGLIIFTISLFALFAAITAILHGGRNLNANWAVVYSAIAASGCLITALLQRKIAHQVRSVMLDIDAKNWIINGLISLSVGIAFGLVGFIQNTPLSWFLPYADSTIVTILVLITLPVPVKIILQNIKQLLLGAPNTELQQQLQQIFEGAAQDFPMEKNWIRTTQIGNHVFMSIYWLLPSDCSEHTVAQSDRIRETIVNALQQAYPDLIVDLIFTQDAKWAEDITV